MLCSSSAAIVSLQGRRTVHPLPILAGALICWGEEPVACSAGSGVSKPLALGAHPAPMAKPAADARGRSIDRWTRPPLTGRRSEEHTSELQSRGHIVCRLLLETKKSKREI